MDKYPFPHDASPNPQSVVSGERFRFTVISDVVLRYEWADDGQFEDRPSTFAINRNFPRPEFDVKVEDGTLHITSATFHLTYDKKKFGSGLRVKFPSRGVLPAAEWRFGDAPQQNLGGTTRTLDKVNGRCDLGNGVLSRAGFAAIDDSKSVLFGNDNFVAPRRSGHRIDGYLFSYGEDYQSAMRAFHAISGSQPQIPRWALGNWWCRYYSYTADEYLELMDKFKNRKVPLSVAVVDMGWHLSGWTGYTWNKKLFPDPEAFAKALHDRRLQMSLNDHPHEGIQPFEEQYEDVVRAMGQDPEEKKTVPFDCADPTYLRAYYDIVHTSLEKKGCDFWWVDWQQGTRSRMPGLDPLWALNHFQYLDQAKKAKSTEPLLLSRYAGPGSHRYPLGFSGDTIVTWESLQFQPEFTATASNIGYGWWSHDIGGHIGGYRDDELTARWVQLGVFSPVLRLHSTQSQWNGKEPWNYRPECCAVMEQFMRLRHRLVPYLYTASVATAEHDIPLVRPLYWEFPRLDEAYKYANEFLFGSSLVAAPVVQPRDPRTALAEVKVWVPPGLHVDIVTGRAYNGGREVTMYRSLETLPILGPEGAIVPLDARVATPNGCDNPSALEVLVVVGRSGKFTIMEDDRDGVEGATGARRSIPIEFDQRTGRLTASGGGKQWSFRFLSVRQFAVRVLVDGVREDATIAAFSKGRLPLAAEMSSTVVTIKRRLSPESTITIDLGPNPQLDPLDHGATMHDMLLDFQIEYSLKDKIWGIVTSNKEAAEKVKDLRNLRLDEAVVGPFIELLLAGSD